MLEWNVLYEDVNKKVITTFNIFEHFGFLQDLNEMFKELKKEKINFLKKNKLEEPLTLKESDTLNEYINTLENDLLRRKCSYNFWAKAEYEVVITSWPPYISNQELGRLNVESIKAVENRKVDLSPIFDVNLEVSEKLDIYDQLRLNWSAFKDFIFSHESDIKKLFSDRSKKLKSIEQNNKKDK